MPNHNLPAPNYYKKCPSCSHPLGALSTRQFCEFCGKDLRLDTIETLQLQDRLAAIIERGPLVKRPDGPDFYFPAAFYHNAQQLAQQGDRETSFANRRLINYFNDGWTQEGRLVYQRFLTEVEILNPGYFNFLSVQAFLSAQGEPTDEDFVIAEIIKRRQDVEEVFINWISQGELLSDRQKSLKLADYKTKISIRDQKRCVIAAIVMLIIAFIMLVCFA